MITVTYMSTTTATATFDMVPTSDHRAETYGVIYESALAIRMVGPKVYNRSFPHRVQVWSNTNRPNTHPGEIRYGDHGPIGGDGQYLDPFNRATDEPITACMSAESMIIDGRTGIAYADETVSDGDVIALRFPDGDVVCYEVQCKQMSDPRLVPVKA